VIIAVDGPAASGKGTLARRLATHFGFAYLDTGKIYRAVGCRVLDADGDPEDQEAALSAAEALQPGDLNNSNLTSDRAAVAASKVAAMEPVRTMLLGFQQVFAANPPNGASGVVLDGRDIGTVVCPDAAVKLFVTAAIEERAERRHKELLDKGEPSIYSRVLQALKDRDARDIKRSAAPLVAAPDAISVDTTGMDPDEAFASVLDSIRHITG
jgi:cytidylate kinase